MNKKRNVITLSIILLITIFSTELKSAEGPYICRIVSSQTEQICFDSALISDIWSLMQEFNKDKAERLKPLTFFFSKIVPCQKFLENFGSNTFVDKNNNLTMHRPLDFPFSSREELSKDLQNDLKSIPHNETLPIEDKIYFFKKMVPFIISHNLISHEQIHDAIFSLFNSLKIGNTLAKTIVDFVCSGVCSIFYIIQNDNQVARIYDLLSSNKSDESEEIEEHARGSLYGMLWTLNSHLRLPLFLRIPPPCLTQEGTTLFMQGYIYSVQRAGYPSSVFANLAQAQHVINRCDELRTILQAGNLSEKLLSSAIKEGVNINMFDSHGMTLLHYAAQGGHLKAIKLLLKYGANVDAVTVWHRMTPLHLAAKTKYLYSAQLLVANGASVNAKMHFGTTPLHEAAQEGNIAMILFLLTSGANKNSLTRYRQTPLMLAQKSPDTTHAVINILLNAG
ncbi:MAG: ankyrin repeat domain-containing protein [Epsilonproteobacteria bacterium]|nr:ankyrin repeat domain-containing protein [Campylobacterota bacterium]